MKLNSNEKKVLEALVTYDGPEGQYYVSFATISSDIGLDRKMVRRACRSLARKGLAEYQRTTWRDEGVGGAAYGATKEGCAAIETATVP